MLVRAVEARPVRSLACLAEELGTGVTGVIGPNGAGKTNLLEALYFSLTGRSFRTSDRRDLIPFGGDIARAGATVVTEDGASHRFIASVSRRAGGCCSTAARPSPPRWPAAVRRSLSSPPTG
jgi:recombinational DNA repair ATPase RecF